jgi:hypothetical protein
MELGPPASRGALAVISAVVSILLAAVWLLPMVSGSLTGVLRRLMILGLKEAVVEIRY